MNTLEALIALAVLTLGISASVLVSFGSQSLAVDVQTNREALSKAHAALEDTRATSRQDFASIVSQATTTDDMYLKRFELLDDEQCKKVVLSRVVWNVTPSRHEKVELQSSLGDIALALAYGGDCIVDPPHSIWDNPQRFASDTISTGKSTAIDVLDKIAYIGADHSPYFYIADTTLAVLGQTSGLLVVFGNGFDAGAQINSLDAIHDLSSGKNYVFAAMDAPTNQLEVIDVTDIHNPVIAATRSLSPCVAGSYPQGWRVRYYGGKLYVTTRFTAGPEFHVFDVTTPANPTEYTIGGGVCRGFNLGDTANDFVVKDQIVGGMSKRFIYLATDEIDKELRVFDVTDPIHMSEVTPANQDLPGAQNGLSVFLLGNKLYVGRQSTPGGPDLYIYGVSNPLAGLTLLDSQDIGTGVLAIRVAGRFAFLATPKSNKEFQVWDISKPLAITRIKDYSFGNIVDEGLDYESDSIYATGQATPNFQMLYRP